MLETYSQEEREKYNALRQQELAECRKGGTHRNRWDAATFKTVEERSAYRGYRGLLMSLEAMER